MAETLIEKRCADFAVAKEQLSRLEELCREGASVPEMQRVADTIKTALNRAMSAW